MSTEAAESLEEILRKLISSIPEVKSAAIVSVEGLPIASALPRNVDETRVAAMTAAMLSLGERAAQEFEKGDLEQVYVRGVDGFVFVMSAGSNAVLTISTSKDVKMGLIFWDGKRACEKIAKQV
jgi:predicted regulator of Ras-like GTPase activity (Roadblock/LC7/MglB family)